MVSYQSVGDFPGMMKMIIGSDMIQRQRRLNITGWIRCSISGMSDEAREGREHFKN